MKKYLFIRFLILAFLSLFFLFADITAAEQQRKSSLNDTKLTWETTSASNDIAIYALYFRENPNSKNFAKLKKLIDKYLLNVIAQAEKEGKEVSHNATSFHVRITGKWAMMTRSQFSLGGGKMDLDSMRWYSDPTDILVIEGCDGEELCYVKGKGIGIINNKVYTFGFYERGIKALFDALQDENEAVRLQAIDDIWAWGSKNGKKIYSLRFTNAEGITKWQFLADPPINRFLQLLRDPNISFKGIRNIEIVSGIYPIFIERGEVGTENMLIKILNESGSTDMAYDFLNCGNSKLENAAESWVRKHGYTIKTAYGQYHSPRWGSLIDR